MIYAALAAVVLGLLSWDFGRRWLVSRNEYLRADFDKFRHQMLEEVGDIRTAHNLRVREFSDRGADLSEKLTQVDQHCSQLDVCVGTLRSNLEELGTQKAEPVDLTKHNKAVENLARQLHELSKISVTQEQLKAIEDRFNATLTGAVAKGARIRA